MNEDKLANDLQRGARADALLRDDILIEAFAKLDAEYVEAWRRTDARDDDARQRLWQAVQVLGKVRAHLTTLVANGRVAKHDIDQLAEKRRRS